MKKRLISMLLTVLMVASLFGGMSVSAYADEAYATQEYTLKSGDTLLKVCTKLGLNWFSCQTAINKLNNISEAQYRKLSVGQTIKLPATNEDAVKIVKAGTSSGSTGGTVISGGTGSSTSGSASASGVNAAYWLIPYTMQKGETVAGVCNTLGISFATYSEQIKTINNISTWSKVAAGKTLLLPSASAPAAGTSCYAVVAHQIQKGETTYSICNQYGISYNANASLMQTLNKGTSLTNIKYGRTLYVPVATVAGSSSSSGSSGSTTGGTVISGGTGSSSGSGSGSSSGSGSTTTKTYKLRSGTVTNGKISFTVGGKTVTSAAAGSTVTIVATPDSMCGLKSVSLKYADGSATPKVTDGSFTMPECDVVVNATFDKGYYMGAISAHGTVTLYNNNVATTTAAKGAEITVKVSPDAGYTVSRIYVQKNDGSKTIVKDDMKSGSTFTMPDCAVFVRVEYTETAGYKLTKVNTDLKGSYKTLVNGSEVSKASSGATVEIVCSPASGYAAEDKDITVTSVAYGTKISVVNGKFTMPASDVNIKVEFQKSSQDKYALIAGSEYAGTVTFQVGGKDTYTAAKGDEVTVNTAFREGYYKLYYLEKFVVTGAGNTMELKPANNKFTMPAYDVTVTPVFKPKEATITEIKSNDNTLGDIVVTVDGKTVAAGQNVAVDTTIRVNVPSVKTGYAVDKVNVYYLDYDGNNQVKTLAAGESWTIPACSQISVEVIFKVTDFTIKIENNWNDCYDLTISVGADAGSYSAPKAGTKFQVANTAQVTATAKSGYKVTGIQVKNLKGEVTTYDRNWFIMPAEHLYVTVLMEAVPAKAAPSSLSLAPEASVELELAP